MIERVQLGFAIFGGVCALLFCAALGFCVWDTRAVARRVLSLLLAPAARPSKAPMGYDVARGTPPPPKADVPPDSAC